LSADEAAANATALALAIPAAFWAELQDEGLLHPAAPVPGV
jgi:hypothetical protein